GQPRLRLQGHRPAARRVAGAAGTGRRVTMPSPRVATRGLAPPRAILYNNTSCERDRKRSDSMPHTRSAKKQLRKTEKRRLRNRATMKALKTQIKKVLAASTGASLDELRKEFNL